jgi:D-beta-D-heptose 7-phosphate kinase/D-beta-D-heptose 1-phosphate adenosyltransferase
MTSKIVPRSEISALVKSLKAQKKRIVFTNGCFDLLHAGHVRYLTEARAQGDCLIVGLNTDRSVNRIKDPHRPLIPEDQRAEVLAALLCVSYVVFFEEPDPLRLIEAIKPDVLVKGADWAEDDIIGAGLVRSYGGRVFRVALVGGISTSEIIRRIVERYGQNSLKGSN